MIKSKLDLGFVILCPDNEEKGLKTTLSSLKNYYTESNRICIVGSDITVKESKDLKEHCPVHKGKDTITSLINVGMNKLKNEWGLILFSGSRLRSNIFSKLNLFAKNKHDVLFPVVDKKMDFVEGSFNGVLINKNFFKKVGNFPDNKIKSGKIGLNDFEISKLLWANYAIDNGCQFKAIMGMRIY